MSPCGVGGLINPCKVLPPQEELLQQGKVLISVEWKNSTAGKRGSLQDADTVEERDGDSGRKKTEKAKKESGICSIQCTLCTAYCTLGRTQL